MSEHLLRATAEPEAKRTQTPTINLKPQNEIAELKELFAEHLRGSDRLRRPEGLPTGVQPLDRFLFWGGLPKGALSLFTGALGSGATSLWVEAAAKVIAEGRWVAWINGRAPLSPLSLHQKGVDLSRFVSVMAPADEKKLLWLLLELMSSSLFDLVGCDLGSLRLREHQLRKLQMHARQTKSALALISTENFYKRSAATVFALIIGFEDRRLLVERALHRPTPHAFPRSVNYARFTFHTGDRIGLGTDLFAGARLTPDRQKREPDSLLATARAAEFGTDD